MRDSRIQDSAGREKSANSPLTASVSPGVDLAARERRGSGSPLLRCCGLAVAEACEEETSVVAVICIIKRELYFRASAKARERRERKKWTWSGKKKTRLEPSKALHFFRLLFRRLCSHPPLFFRFKKQNSRRSSHVRRAGASSPLLFSPFLLSRASATQALFPPATSTARWKLHSTCATRRKDASKKTVAIVAITVAFCSLNCSRAASVSTRPSTSLLFQPRQSPSGPVLPSREGGGFERTDRTGSGERGGNFLASPTLPTTTKPGGVPPPSPRV